MDQLRCLRVFVQVIADGSFAGAARTLDLAPAVVTRAITDLEAHLGARLLNRTTRSLALTDIGDVYLLRAQQVLADLGEADALAGASASKPGGTLRVCCPPAFAVHQLAKHLPRFYALFPDISIEMSAPGPVEVAGENFDVSILSLGQQPLQGEFVARLLVNSSFIVCAAKAYLDRHGRPAQPEDLLQHQGLLPAVAAVRRELTLYRQTPDPTPGVRNLVVLPLRPPVLSTSHIEVLLSAALAGLGVAGLPSFVVQEALQTGRLERVLQQWRGTTLKIYAAMPSTQHVPRRTRVFVDYLVETFGGVDHDPWIATESGSPVAGSPPAHPGL